MTVSSCCCDGHNYNCMMMMCLLWSWSMTLSYSFFFAWDDVDGIKEAFLSVLGCFDCLSCDYFVCRAIDFVLILKISLWNSLLA